MSQAISCSLPIHYSDNSYSPHLNYILHWPHVRYLSYITFLQASPCPDVIWLKDGTHVSKRATISNTDGCSQILIPSADRSDSGIYAIIVKNVVGQEAFSIEIRVTGKMREPVYVWNQCTILNSITK